MHAQRQIWQRSVEVKKGKQTDFEGRASMQARRSAGAALQRLQNSCLVSGLSPVHMAAKRNILAVLSGVSHVWEIDISLLVDYSSDYDD